jgi:hypothetical protein
MFGVMILIERPNVHILDNLDHFETASAHEMSSLKETFGVSDGVGRHRNQARDPP